MLAVLLAVHVATTFALSFTGDVEKDFVSQSNMLVLTFADGEFNGVGFADVGTPPGWPYERSGWDMKDLRLAYDFTTDQLHIGINCWDVCGDADGDGDPGVTSSELQARGGIDIPNFQNSESFAVGMDVGASGTGEPDGVMDFGLGYPSQPPEGERLACGVNLGSECFGIYGYDTSPGANVPGQRLLASGPAFKHPAVDHNPRTSRAKPDLEWTINDFNGLRAKLNVPAVDRTGALPWALNFLAFGGSFQDDGVGEDSFPNDAPFKRAQFPCQRVDACDICGGDGSTCLDCAGVPNGPAVYDNCDICGGPNEVDCAGVPCGSSRPDFCGVCNGDGTTCKPPRAVCSEEFGNVCKFHPGDVWVGAYRDTNVDVSLAEAKVTFTFAPNNYVMETNKLGTNWNRWVITDDYLAVQQFASFPARVARGCAPDNVAKYALKFSADCMTAEVEAIIETCRGREALYNNMQFTLQKVTKPDTDNNACEPWDGSGIWQAKYRTRVNAWTGKHQVGTFTFAPENHAVVESGDDAVYFYTWRPTVRGTVEVRDIGSQDFEQRCMEMTTPTLAQRTPLPITALYQVQYGEMCSQAQIGTTGEGDRCKERARRLEGLQLHRVPLPSEVQKMDSACLAACKLRLANAEEVAECVDRCEAYNEKKR